MSGGIPFSLALERMLKMDTARVLTVSCGFQPFPKRSRQMSPLVYTCKWRGVGLRKYTEGGLVGYSLEN